MNEENQEQLSSVPSWRRVLNHIIGWGIIGCFILFLVEWYQTPPSQVAKGVIDQIEIDQDWEPDYFWGGIRKSRKTYTETRISPECFRGVEVYVDDLSMDSSLTYRDELHIRAALDKKLDEMRLKVFQKP